MATYGQRDKFLQAVVTFTISEQAKEMTAPERQDLLIKIRDKYAPDITNAEWGDIAKGINDFKFVISESVKYGEVPHIENQLSEKEPEPIQEPEINYQETQAESPHLDKSMESTEEEVVEEKESEDNTVAADEEDDSEDNSDLEDSEGASEEDDYSEDEKPVEPEPKPTPAKVFGKFTKPKEVTQKKVSTSKLRGLLKPKK